MTDREQIAAFEADLDKLVSRYCQEFEISVAGAIGVLEMKKHRLIAEALEDGTEPFEPYHPCGELSNHLRKRRSWSSSRKGRTTIRFRTPLIQ